MERYVCIHGHFYQPPRENPWLEGVELQDSAYPYHDWNERITAECYAANGYARILDGSGRIERIVNNYARISFNFGPTLLSWMKDKSPEAYSSVLAADRESGERFSGHGSAMAQAYNHVILPLANRRDKATQVRWGIRDFEARFGRRPEGMWLPETAVDVETLEVLAEQGVRFTVLSPYQAGRVRKVGEQGWRDVSGGRVDPTTAYVQRLPSGREVALFFYDGPTARAVAFERLLTRGEDLANRLLGGFSDSRPWAQLVHIATDGESYGHHHAHGDMALAYALRQIESAGGVRLTNYGEFLERHPPTHEVEVIENTAWSCAHGVGRWRGNCGCSSGRPGWDQSWRGPLREALDWLRDALAPAFEKRGRELFKDPWAARDGYVDVILDRGPDNLQRFFAAQASHELTKEEEVTALRLLELQRQALLMYTSCGWFFDEVSGLETVQVIQYAGRAIQLAQGLFGDGLEGRFLELLEKAKSNLREHRDGRLVYEKFVRPAVLDWEDVGAHYAVSSLFEAYPERARIFCYTAASEGHHAWEAGKVRMVAGRVRVISEVTHEEEELSYGALHFGDHNVNCGVAPYREGGAYEGLVRDLGDAFGRADFPEVIRVMDRGFGESTYSIRSLFRDEQRRVLRRVLQASQAESEALYRRLYEQYMPTMRFLANLGVPLPLTFQTTAEFLLNTDLRWAFEDDEPNLEHIRGLLRDAGTWRVSLDTAGLAYQFKRTIGRMAGRFASHPDDLALLESLDAAVELARGLPFEVDLWNAQNAYWGLTHTAFAGHLDRVTRGDPSAPVWLERFLTLGEKLGMQTGELRGRAAEAKKAPTLADVVGEMFRRRRVPRATYRLQFNPQFTFRDGREVVGYLRELGVSDCYSSPVLKAKPGSAHGYDICDHGKLNPELGGEEGFEVLSAALREAGMGLVLDTVPNHMGIGHPSNGWWMDVLENGPTSIYASYFDIDWRPVNPALENKVLLPFLGDQYGTVLEGGQIRLAYDNGAFFLHYYDYRWPVAPRAYALILEDRLEELSARLGAEHDHVLELRSILTALNYLPRRPDLPPEKMIERNREKEVIKRRVAALAGASPEVRGAIESTVRAFNGSVGDGRSFDRLDELLGLQPYRPAYWRVATEEINYRRFFDINELAAIRTELPEVFCATHQLVFRLLAEGKVTGLRIDHPDGLRDPTSYFLRLQENYLLHRARAAGGPGRNWEGLEGAVAEQLRECVARAEEGPDNVGRGGWPLYVVAEKILGENEPLPHDWAVDGTTGYDFLNAVNGLFVDRSQSEAFTALYHQFTGKRSDFGAMLISTQRMILRESMTSELNALGHELDRISERNRRYRDFTLNSLTLGIREVIAGLVIYRTYISDPERGVALRDRRFIEEAVETAREENPRVASSVLDFIRDTLLLRNLGDFGEEDRPRVLNWVLKFQQLTGPVLAKALEDTVFYQYNRLVSLNEVGGHPERFGVTVADFHRENADRARRWPHTMLATSTHDTKRSEDVRARIDVLSEVPEEWELALKRWAHLNAAKKGIVDNRPSPDRSDEYLLYQTLVGAWPPELFPASTERPFSLEASGGAGGEAFGTFRERITQYMQKAIKEAKVRTSWINPNEDYDGAVREFVAKVLSDAADDPFVSDVRAFARRVSFYGYLNSLAQVVLKLASPGVPDFYQGTELWDFSLVDPDNRRPVDYALRRRLLAELRGRIESAGADLAGLAGELLGGLADGRVKLYVIYRTLHFRREREEFFRDGGYVPLGVAGEKADHVCAFARVVGDKQVLVAVPRLVVRLTGGQPVVPLGPERWQETRLVLPAEVTGRRWKNLYTGEVVEAGQQEGEVVLSVASVLRSFPVAVLYPAGEGRAAADGQRG